MGYDKSKIYQLVCDDGHFYYGSTINELRVRLQGHINQSKTRTSRVYNHINSIGWDRVRIILVESFVCANRDELHRKENEYIQARKTDPLCLNTAGAVFDEEKTRETMKKYRETHQEQIKAYSEAHRDKANAESKLYYEAHKEEKKKYKEANRERINAKWNERYARRKIMSSMINADTETVSENADVNGAGAKVLA